MLTSITSLIPKILFLVKQIRPTRTQIYNLRTPVSIFFQSGTFEAVEGITDSLATTHDTFIRKVAERALIAYSHEGGRSNVGIADWTFAVAFIA